MAAGAPQTYYVDAMNVIGSRPDGWWRDRDGAVRRLIDGLTALAAATGDRFVVAVDGRPIPGLAETERGAVQVRYARRTGRDAADDRIVELLAHAPPEAVVVTADRDLRSRVAERGHAAVGPRALLHRLDDIADV